MQFVIQGRPITKKNSMQILGMGRKCPSCGKFARMFPAPSKQYKKYEAEAVRQLMLQRIPFTDPIDYPVNVKCVYYMPTEGKVDLCNLLEATCDIMQKAEIIKDDCSSIVHSHDGSRVTVDKTVPRVEITIDAAR